MTAVVQTLQTVIVGVDTHQRTHHAVVLDSEGRRLGDREFPVSDAGYAALLTWAAAFGVIDRFGVESTGSYGAGLTRFLLAEAVDVIEVNRPDRATRVMDGKSDPLDAEAAARAVLSGRVTARPKLTTGVVESIRVLKNTRDSALTARNAALSQLRDLITTAPAELHDTLIGLTAKQRVVRAAAFRPDMTRLGEPLHAAKKALRTYALRIHALDAEIAEIDAVLDTLVAKTVPTLVAMPQVGTQTAAQLLITAGENLHRFASEAQFAKLTGVAPIPASSGKTRRMRLSRGGDRQANKALYLIAIGRLRSHQETRDYVARREAEGLSRRDAIRCVKRYLARTTYNALKHDLLRA